MVLIDFPKDTQTGKAEMDFSNNLKIRGFKPNTEPHPVQVKKAVFHFRAFPFETRLSYRRELTLATISISVCPRAHVGAASAANSVKTGFPLRRGSG